jgi:hypothetical protein
MTTGVLTGTATAAAAAASPTAAAVASPTLVACTRSAAAATRTGTDAGASAETRVGAGAGAWLGAAVGAMGLIGGGLLAAPGNGPTGRLAPPGPMTCIGFHVDLACSAFARGLTIDPLSLKGATGMAAAVGGGLGGQATAYGGGGPA